MTWMIAPHSAFLSMSATDDFWTLRILPRIGSSAWNSELRASLAVPSAESPSTMNSSLRVDVVAAAVGELGGQRRGLQGRLAALGLLALARGDAGTGPRRRPSPCTARACWPSRRAWSRSGTPSAPWRPRWPRSGVAAEVPSTSLVWPSNCGSASRTVTTAVRPSRASSLTMSSSATRSSFVGAQHLVHRLGHRAARSRPTWVPPLGVAMMLTNDLIVVS